MDEGIWEEEECGEPEEADDGGGPDGIGESFFDAREESGAEVLREDGLSGLTDAIATALDEGADGDDDAVDGEFVGSEVV